MRSFLKVESESLQHYFCLSLFNVKFCLLRSKSLNDLFQSRSVLCFGTRVPYLSVTQSYVVRLTWNPLCRHDIKSPFPWSGNEGYVRNQDVVLLFLRLITQGKPDCLFTSNKLSLWDTFLFKAIVKAIVVLYHTEMVNSSVRLLW